MKLWYIFKTFYPLKKYKNLDSASVCVSASSRSIQVTRDNETVDSRTCVFWDKIDQGGRWSSEGCRRENNPDINMIRCLCDHLTSFAVLMVHYYFLSWYLISLLKIRIRHVVNIWKKIVSYLPRSVTLEYFSILKPLSYIIP